MRAWTSGTTWPRSPRAWQPRSENGSARERTSPPWRRRRKWTWHEVRVRRRPAQGKLGDMVESDGEETEVSVPKRRWRRRSIPRRAGGRGRRAEPVVGRARPRSSKPSPSKRCRPSLCLRRSPRRAGRRGTDAGAERRPEGGREAPGAAQTHGEDQRAHRGSARRADAGQTQACKAQRTAGRPRRGAGAHGSSCGPGSSLDMTPR